ncbi:MAG: biotin/lipoyl-containing protein [Desulfobacterales bacterium]|nr:biotin/lipoyl-containing protein [Desulfobacterales bacterium]
MPQDVLSPLSGKIFKINVQVGDTVEEDDEIIIIEAMKMETPVFSPCAGTIKEIKVKEGATIEEDDVLAIIE